MKLRNFDELIGVAKVGGRKKIAVARAEDASVLEGVRLGYEEEMVEPILCGDKARIHETMQALGIEADWTIEHIDGDNNLAAKRAVEIVKAGEADLLMKGHMQTGTLFKAVLNKNDGLEYDGLLSHLAFVSIPVYPKVFAFTDGGLNLAPNFEQKKKIVENAVRAFHKLGYLSPKIGLLSYIEKVHEGDTETSDWGRISALAKEGEFGQAQIEGPLAMDLCLSKQAKELKGLDSDVAGDVDVIVAPNITSCNASTKAMILVGGTAAGIVVGASAPIVALSRGDTPRIRLCSLATGLALLS